MANPNPQLSTTINKALRTLYQQFETNYPESVGMAKMMQGRQIMEGKFTELLSNCPTHYLKNNDFRRALQDTVGMEPVDSILFLQAVSETYRRLGLSFF